jgi:Na+/H+ antiporter NhaD/arsenite permease-like protein
MFVSAIFSALMGEVTSTIIMVTTILGMCSFLEISPVPLVISSVLATNIGSAATVLGNPVGVLIAARSGLSFEDFLIHALPPSVIILAVTSVILCLWYKDYIQEISRKLKAFGENEGFIRLISIPPDTRTRISVIIIGITIFLMALHKRLEALIGLERNTLLIVIPIIAAGIVLLYRHDRARAYIEREVEWNSLLFFLFLFAQAGVIQASGVALFFAERIVSVTGKQPEILSGVILFSSGFLSSGVDNVVTVASFVPVIKGLNILNLHPDALWWPLLFGACFGGNITMIGSTANIVAIGLLEKQLNIKVSFKEWLKVGLVVGLVSMVIAYVVVLLFCLRIYAIV